MDAADHNLVLTEPASKLKHLREKLLTARRRGSGRRRWRYLSILAAGFFVATAAAILLNALVWQRTRHPAPLAAPPAPVPPAKEPTTAGRGPATASRLPPAVPPAQPREKPAEKPPLE